ncbi:MAG: neutral zinc metallopeptidase [Polyangiales bacterium]
MRWDQGHQSPDLIDARGSGGVGGFGGMRLGLGGFVVLGVLSLVFGRNFFSMLGGGGAPARPAATAPRAADPNEDRQVRFVGFVLDDVQATWGQLMPRLGRPYERAQLVVFTEAVQSGCGVAGAETGPFYCPADRRVYLDVSFFRELRGRFGAPGDFAQAYVVAHEVGHHVQRLAGIDARVRQATARSPGQENALSVRQELQADCFAGVWAHATSQRGLVEAGDVEEALGAAAAVGDDRIQRSAGRRVNPESWTHGSAQQRAAWFRRGLQTGDPSRCDTFNDVDPS